ncbi:MAG: transposase [Sedimentisphaerales bacterium]|nr:transposase [Sedimentisphaerales bacterium]
MFTFIFRVALSNKNILRVTESQVPFRYRESKTNVVKIQTLPAEQFLHRFLQHVLPKGFQKVRTFGLYHPKQRHKLELIKEQLEPKDTTIDAVPKQAKPVKKTQQDFCCPHCACQMPIIGKKLSKPRGPPLWK